MRSLMFRAAHTLLAGSLMFAGCNGGSEPDAADGTETESAGASEEGGSDDASEGGEEPLCAHPEVGESNLRRLTAAQYDHTVRDLFGVSGTFASRFSPDERIGPFKSNVAAPVGELQVEQFMDVAEDVAAAAITNLATLLPCDPASEGADACAEEFAAKMGPRAYRRPVTAEELDALLAVFDVGRSQAGFPSGIRLMIAAMLQSPNFLYHLEFGAEDGSDGSIVAVGDYELASRISYFLWDSMPDDELFAAAAAGELRSDAGISAEVDRMLADPRAADAVGSFHLQWLGIDELEQVEKAPAVFPEYSWELAQAMKADTAAFATSIVLEGDGELRSLLTASYTLSEDPELLALYGAELPLDHQAGAPVPLDPAQRAGLLTQPSLMARHAHPDQTSPILRGVLVRQNFLCQLLPPPPPDVDNVPPDSDPNATTRERFADIPRTPRAPAATS